VLIYISNQWYQAGEIGVDFRQEGLKISDKAHIASALKQMVKDGAFPAT